MRYNPFNPQLPARPAIFVGREPEITIFEKYLSQTLHGSPMNMSITGNRGMGKTSILCKFEEIAKDEGCLVLRMSNYEGNITNPVELAEFITTNLKREILTQKPLGPEWDKLKEWAVSIRPTIGFGDISLKIERDPVAQEMFRDRLTKLWHEMEKNRNAAVLLIDEAESLERVEGALVFLREVLQRTATDAKYMVVLAGKLNFPERMSESFSPLNRFFPCQTLAPFDRKEVEEYVQRQLKSVKVGIEAAPLHYIIEKSEGHPYVIVAMCNLIFDAIQDGQNTIKHDMIAQVEEKINAKLAQDFFNPMYHPLTPKAKQIIKAIALNVESLEFSFSDAVKWVGTPGNRISPYILELVRKGVIIKPERGRYQIFHGLFKDFVNGLAK